MKEGSKEEQAKAPRASRSKWAAIIVLAGLLCGCCSHPGVFQQVERSFKTVHNLYEPLLQEFEQDLMNDEVRLAVVAADTTLLLATELQAQWCPPLQAVEQLELQAAAAKKLAEEAGVQVPQAEPTSEPESLEPESKPDSESESEPQVTP
jgi:hypothetical protein